MKTVYLKDGRMADLVTKTDKGYLVDPYIIWNDYDGQSESAPSGQVELVTEVFDTAPVALIEAEYKKILDRVEEQEKLLHIKREEHNKLSNEVHRLKTQKTDLSRYIINREELRTAKRLIIWPTDEIVPRILDAQNSNKFAVTYEISQYKGEEKVWCYKPSYEDNGRHRGWSSYSQYFDEKYGIKIDLTDDEIFQLTIERIPRFKKDSSSWKHVLLRTPDNWLTPEFLAEKKSIAEEEKKNALELARKELQNAQAKLDKLMGKELVAE